MSINEGRISRGICLMLILFFCAACTAYQPPFTQYLNTRMNFADVLNVAQDKGYMNYCEIADYKGYRLLCFKNVEEGRNIFLVVNRRGEPMLHSLENSTIDEAKLVNFVDDLLIHGKG